MPVLRTSWLPPCVPHNCSRDSWWLQPRCHAVKALLISSLALLSCGSTHHLDGKHRANHSGCGAVEAKCAALPAIVAVPQVMPLTVSGGVPTVVRPRGSVSGG